MSLELGLTLHPCVRCCDSACASRVSHIEFCVSHAFDFDVCRAHHLTAHSRRSAIHRARTFVTCQSVGGVFTVMGPPLQCARSLCVAWSTL